MKPKYMLRLRALSIRKRSIALETRGCPNAALGGGLLARPMQTRAHSKKSAISTTNEKVSERLMSM